MTERKGLKRIVRARMERTGETYTTAHRTVAARRPRPLPPGLVPGYRTFGRERHHHSSLVRNMLAQAGLPLTEAMVCGLGGGVGFLYAVFEYAAVPHPLLTIVAQHHPQPWVTTVLGHLDVPWTEQHSTSPSAAMAKLRRSLAAGRPVWCTVQRSALPWQAPGWYGADAADPYPVVVAGLDGDTLYVDDTTDHPRAIEAEVFAAAWSGHRKGRHHMLTINPGVGTGTGRARAVAPAVSMTTAHLTGPVLGNAFDVNMGLSGMAKFAAELRGQRARTAWRRRFAADPAFAHAMLRLDECLQREHTAPDATRPIYADFLDEAVPLLPNVDAAGAAGLFRQSSARWRAITELARGTNTEPSSRPELFNEIADHVEAARDVESQAVRLLRV